MLTLRASTCWQSVWRRIFWSSTQWGGAFGEIWMKRDRNYTNCICFANWSKKNTRKHLLYRALKGIGDCHVIKNKQPELTMCLLEGETMLLLGEGVENLMCDKLAEVSVGCAGLECAGPLWPPSSFSSSSSMPSPLSPSCWFTSFRRSRISSMDTGNWDTNVINTYKAAVVLICTS